MDFQQYIDSIDNLPSQVHSMLFSIRELDLTAEDYIRKMDLKLKSCQGKVVKPETFSKSIQKLFDGAKECSDDKIALATQIHEMVEKYIQRLDLELETLESKLNESLQTKSQKKRKTNKKPLKKDKKKDVLKMPVVPIQQIYCYCRQIAHGSMVACDNLECLNEWFHFPCAGLIDQPKGQWFCRDCEKK